MLSLVSMKRYLQSVLTYLRRRDYTLSLCASCNQPATDTSQIWVGTQALPVSSTSCDSTNWPNERTERYVDTFPTVLAPERMTIPQHKVSVEGCSKMDSRRERRDEFLTANTGWRIGEAQLRDIQTRHCACLTNTRASHAMCKV